MRLLSTTALALFLTISIQRLRECRRLAAAPAPPAPVVFSQYIYLSGATGMHQNDINGIYIKTFEMHDGFPRYMKRGGQDIWLEFFALVGWQVKHRTGKGTNSCYAFIQHLGDLSLRPKSLRWYLPTTFPTALDVTTLVDSAALAVSSLSPRLL